MENRIVIDPEIQHGKPVIGGARVPVVRIIGGLAGGMTTEEIIRGTHTPSKCNSVFYSSSHRSFSSAKRSALSIRRETGHRGTWQNETSSATPSPPCGGRAGWMNGNFSKKTKKILDKKRKTWLDNGSGKKSLTEKEGSVTMPLVLEGVEIIGLM